MNGTSEDPIGQITKIVLAVAGVLTAVTYGIVRLVYVQFYSALGVSLEEVGLGKADLLYQALAGPIAIAILYGGGLGVVLVARSLSRGEASSDSRGIGIALLAFAVAIAVGFMFLEAKDEASDIRTKGETILFQGFNLGVVQLPVAEFRALPIEVHGDGADELLPDGTDCMLYLGQANSVAVLYDVKNRKTVRFPTDGLSLEVDVKGEEVAPECLPGPASDGERSL